MRFNLNDTITAIATPAGNSAIAVIRVSGKDAIAIVSNIFSQKHKLLSAEGYQAVHGYIINGKETLDEVMCLIYRNPHSYTGEDMVEISGHGNPDITNRILQLLLRDCRLAEPGEFTFRAFMNHKLDLAQAEAVNDVINARTIKAEASALNQLKGSLSKQIMALADSLTNSRIQLELAIDFADQDLPGIDLEAVKRRLEEDYLKLKDLVKSGKQGKILRDGFTICLCGAPNVGKSSVFNKFLAEDRAIVTPIPGTTRDYLEEWLALDGYPIRLIDTAGLRDTQDTVERIGIDRSKDLIDKADLVICIFDPETIAHDVLTEYFHEEKTIFALNKLDLLGFESIPEPQAWLNYCDHSRFTHLKGFSHTLIPCSVMLKDGLSALKQQIIQRVADPELEQQSILVTNTRHLAAIDRSITSLQHAIQGTNDNSGYEFIAFDVIQAVSDLSEITGAITTEDMLERIFSEFCIGK